MDRSAAVVFESQPLRQQAAVRVLVAFHSAGPRSAPAL